MVILLILLVVSIYMYTITRADPILLEVKEKYKRLREELKSTGDKKFTMLHNEIPIVAYRQMNANLLGVGYNSNKGQEIGICLDGTANEVFHILLHELAHCTVKVYKHNKEFWDNYNTLKNMSISIGIYEAIPRRTPFCGRKISDS